MTIYIVGITFRDEKPNVGKIDDLSAVAYEHGGIGPGVLTDDPRGHVQYCFNAMFEGDPTLKNALLFMEETIGLPYVQRESLASSDKPETH